MKSRIFWLQFGGGGGGGDGFLLACEDFGGRFDDSFPACAFIFLSGDQLAHTNSCLLYTSDAADE